MSLQDSADRPFYALVKYEDEYVQSKLLRALERIPSIKFIQDVNEVPKNGKIVQWSAYEQIDFDHLLENPDSSLACSYIIRCLFPRSEYPLASCADLVQESLDPETLLGTYNTYACH